MSRSAHETVLRPVISEKSILQSQVGKYTFAVHADACAGWLQPSKCHRQTPSKN